MKKLPQFTYFFLCGLMLFSVTAMAYIDPSAMTYMVQLIAGVAIAAGAGASFYLRKLKRRFSKGRGTAVRSFAAGDDDDDTGYGDYELEPAPQAQAAAPSPAPAEVSAYLPGPEIAAAPADPFDEMGGEGGLTAENRELRRLLAEERKKVEELKRALHICTAPRK